MPTRKSPSSSSQPKPTKPPVKKEKPGYMGFAINDTVKKIRQRKKMLDDL